MLAPWTGILKTDSQGVLDTLQVGDRDPHEQEVPVNWTVATWFWTALPNSDLLIEIQSVMKLLP
jgi:hypothetical protein